MSERPRIKVRLSKWDVTVEIFAWLILALTWIYVISVYKQLPERIATHYNLAGEADGFGHKSSLLWMMVVPSIIAIGLSILNKYPHIFNYPVEITAENAAQQYQLGSRMIRGLKLAMIIIFTTIAWQTVQTSNHSTAALSVWLLPFSLLCTFVPLIYFIVKMSKHS
jgi:uncharacterized membrane protein